MESNTNTSAQAVAASANVDATAAKPVVKASQTPKMAQPKVATKAPLQPVKRIPIGDGETATQRVEVLNDTTVRVGYSFKLSDAAKERYGAVTTLDFAGCTQADILELATKSLVIKLQRNLRQMSNGALDATVYQNVNVKRDLVEATRSAIDPETRDLHAFARAANLSPDVAAKLLAKIKAGEIVL